jgi:hypothetical protein
MVPASLKPLMPPTFLNEIPKVHLGAIQSLCFSLPTCFLSLSTIFTPSCSRSEWKLVLWLTNLIFGSYFKCYLMFHQQSIQLKHAWCIGGRWIRECFILPTAFRPLCCYSKQCYNFYVLKVILYQFVFIISGL